MQSEERASLLEAEILQLKKQLANAELQFIGVTNKARSGALKLATDQLGQQDPAQLDAATVMKLVEKLGCHFNVFYSPYLEPNHFKAPCPAFRAYDLECFSIPGNDDLGIMADLYECIPPQYHNLLLSPCYQISTDMQDIQHILLNVLRCLRLNDISATVPVGTSLPCVQLDVLDHRHLPFRHPTEQESWVECGLLNISHCSHL